MRNQIYKILEKHLNMYQVVDSGYLNDIAEEIYTLIRPDLNESQKEKWAHHGSEMMASQIRKSIEAGIGRFMNEDANWILDRIIDIQEKSRQLLSYWQESLES